MSRAVGILSVTTALFAASTLYFAWALGVERDRGTSLHESRGTAPAAGDGFATTRENGSRDDAAVGGPGDTRSTDSPGASGGLLSRIGGGKKKRLSPKQKSDLYQQDFTRMYADPVTRQQLIEEQIPMLRDQFIVLERRLELPSDQWQRFLETYAAQEIGRRGASGACANDIECLKRRLGPEAYARYEQEMRDLLGEADLKEFQAFNYSVKERQVVETLQTELAPQQRLSEVAAEDLITALSEVRRATEKNIQAENGSFNMFSGDGYVLSYPPTLKTVDERVEYASGYFEKLRQRAEPLLNPVQLAAYRALQEKALRSLRRGMEATAGR